MRCCQTGCAFEGLRKAVREHEEDRHLIYGEGREPKAWVPSFKGAEAYVLQLLLCTADGHTELKLRDRACR